MGNVHDGVTALVCGQSEKKEMNTLEADRAKSLSQELASSYKTMVQIYAWKDLNELMQKMVDDSYKQVDVTPIEILSIAVVAEASGIRKAIAKIRKHVDYAMNGGPR